MNQEKIKLYFDRLGMPYSPDLTPTKELLFSLHFAHVTRVPFENMDILNRIPLDLEEDALFDKIVVRNRGGICFEVNCLFAHLLRKLGYTCIDYAARWIKGVTGNPMRRHRVFQAKLPTGEAYICDVGNGQRCPRYPVPFIPDVNHPQWGEVYNIALDDTLGY
ncbi:MAG TPA: acetyltransferase, partial [Clostridiales bacterium]|nr:acetyltransferase [Clostridiales bacterium]